jgi:serine/threonine protein kinase
MVFLFFTKVCLSLSICLHPRNYWRWIQLSDFGLAIIDGSQKKNIKLSGTLGYVAPEYILDGNAN